MDWEGQPVALATPHEAISLGINAVHQEVVLCRISRWPATCFSATKKCGLDFCSTVRWCGKASGSLTNSGSNCRRRRSAFHLDHRPAAISRRRPRTMRGTKFLIFDEPTAYLTRREVGQLFALIRRSERARGHHHLYFASAGRSVPAGRPGLDSARWPTGIHPAGCRDE